MTPLLAIDFKTKVCKRYIRHAGKLVCTDEFEVKTEITAEKVEAMRTSPDTTGTPADTQPTFPVVA